MLVVGDVADDQFAITGIGPQLLLASARVAGDHRVGGRQDGLCGSVILFQQNGFGVGKVALELFDVADGGTAEGIDRLVRITHHTQFRRAHVSDASRSDHLPHQHVLRMVGVLVFVDQDVPESASVVLRDLRMSLQHTDRLADQIVEVEGVRGAQALLILPVDLGDRLRGRFAALLGGRGRTVRIHQFVLEVGYRDPDPSGAELLGVEVQVAHDHAEQPARVVRIVDREIGVHPGQQRRLGAQDSHAGGVKSADPHPQRARTDQIDHSFAHLGGGFVGEGDREYLAGTDVALGEQVRDPAGEHRGLARPGAGDDQQR